MKSHLLLTPMLIACSPSQPPAVNEPTATTASVKEASLDEYLAHLREHAAPIDQPWWREVSPGVYEHVKRMPGAKPETATRAELMERFGFKS